MDTETALVAAMNAQGVIDPATRNGIMAIASVEGGFGTMRPEVGYSHTDNSRIRQVFGGRVLSLNDAQLDALKADDRAFFNFVYSGYTQVGHALGNIPDTDDGYNFRGRGPIQITGRYNYDRYSKLAGHPEVMDNVDLVNDPEIGAAMTVAYIRDRYKGGGFDALMAAVGSNTADIAARKRAVFNKYSATHTYDATGAPPAPFAPSQPPSNVAELVRQVQRLLGVTPDADPGPATRAAVSKWRAAHPGA